MIEWSPRAKREFDHAISFANASSPKGAARIGRRIMKRVADLEIFAKQGTPVGRGTRRLEVPGTRYLVFYRLRAETITVIGIVHGKRNRRS